MVRLEIEILKGNFKTTLTRLNETWGLRRKEVGQLPAGIWSVGHAAAGCSSTPWGAPSPGPR